MKNILSIMFLFALLASSCSEDELVKNQSANSLKFTASFEEDESRTYVEEGNLLRWTAGDQISLFVANTLNQQYQFEGKTGANSGYFSRINNSFGTGNDLNCHYAVYPYSSDITITENGVITATLPSKQSYAENSFGLGVNTMVAVTKNTDDTYLKFKNVGGYLKLQLYGNDVTVKSITLQGNSNEKIAGTATITATYGGNPIVNMADDATKTITLDCGENGVKIGSTAETATAFWMVVPPTTFENGFEVTITDVNGNNMTKSTSNEISISRNVIKPMETLEVKFDIEIEETIPNNQIWYTSSDGNIVNPNNTTGFGANMISNVYENGKGIITFDSDVTTIKGSAFSNSNTLTSITIPNNVTIIESSAFYKCNSLKTVVFSNSLNIIREDAFAYCNSLENFTMPNSVTSIGRGAFNGCSSLTNITIPHSVTSISGNPFTWCSSLKNISVEQGNSNYDSRNNCNAIIETASNTLISGCENTIIPNDIVSINGAFAGCTSLTSITIPNSVGIITNGAFVSCTSLANITIPNSVTHILNNAFENCTSLTNITIPESVIEIGDGAFCHCISLINVNVKAKTPPSLDYTGFFDCNNYFIVYVPTESFDVYKKTDYWKNLNLSIETIPNNQIWYTPRNKGEIVTPYSTTGFGAYIVSNDYENGKGITTFDGDVTTIGQSAFYNKSFRSITIPNSVTEIKYNAFYNCSLESITIPNNVTNIGQGAFMNCKNLTYIKISDNVTEINSQMFSGCSSLVNITIPKNVTYIDSKVFDDCNSLRRVDVKATTPPILQDNVFANCSNELKIYVPKESLEAYKNHIYWGKSNLFSDNQ